MFLLPMVVQLAVPIR